jgi:hypothetical protein
VEGREDSMVWLVGGSENGKKEGNARFGSRVCKI